MNSIENKKDEFLTHLTFYNKIKTVCKFCAEVILARNNFGYIRSFIAYKAQKLLIISKNIFINVIFE